MNLELYIIELDKNQEEVTHFLNSCSDSELQMKLGESWSLLEISEHIILTEKIVLKMLSREAKKKIEEAELYGNDKLQRLIVKFRAKKLQAPEMLQPKGDIHSAIGFAESLRELRENLKKNLRNETIQINNSVYTHPYLGEMTISDWLYFIPAHTKRHLDQMAEVLNKLREAP